MRRGVRWLPYVRTRGASGFIRRAAHQRYGPSFLYAPGATGAVQSIPQHVLDLRVEAVQIVLMARTRLNTAIVVFEGAASGDRVDPWLVNAETALHCFCARILGWTADREVAVEHAIRSIELALDHSAALVLLSETDLVPVAHALHRRMLGPEQPFIVCDRNRRNTNASVRCPSNQESGVAAVAAAAG